MEKSAHCCQIYLGSYSSAQALSEFFNSYLSPLTLLPVVIHVQKPD